MSQYPPPAAEVQSFPSEGCTRRSVRPWVTILAMLVAIVIFFWSNAQREYSYEAVRKFGYVSAEDIFSGDYWALITSALVHFDMFHLGFNMYWLWLLGSRMERAIGSGKYLAFFAAAATISSSAELAFTDDTGIGASGVVYAIFGFMMLTRSRFALFTEILNAKTIQSFLVWLVACFAITYLGILNIGNAAHLSGMVFGALVALPVLLRRRALYALPAATILLSIIPLFWAPWSVAWLRVQAYNAHEAKDYPRALDFYTRIIDREPQDAWAYEGRGGAYEALEQHQQAAADFTKAEELGSESR